MKDLVFGKTQSKSEKNFHKERIAFLIVDNNIMFLQNSTMSHWEWFNSLNYNYTKEQFNNVVRGFYLNGKAIFYKGNFDYDDECLKQAKQFAPKVKEYCKVPELEVWCGENVGEVGTVWTPKFFVEKI